MDRIFNQIISYFKKVIEDGIIGLSLLDAIILIFVLIFSLSIRTIFAKFFVKKIEYLIKKTSNKADNLIFDILVGPFKLLPIIIVFIIFSIQLDAGSKFLNLIEKINQSIVTIFIFWLLHSSFILFSHSFSKFEKLLSKAITVWLVNSIKYLIIFLGIVAVLEIWGIKIGPIIAGLGLFGVAVALGAQDLFKNLISGILILVEKRFQIGDVINVPTYGDGVVEQIGFRSTTIRKFDSTPITLPNYVLADSAISNYSHRHYRRISWEICLTYSTSVQQLKNITKEIKDYITENKDDFIINNDYKCYVRLEKFNDSSIDIMIYCFTNTNVWDEYLKIREKLAFNVKQIVENKNNADFAFPSQSIYIEKK